MDRNILVFEPWTWCSGRHFLLQHSSVCLFVCVNLLGFLIFLPPLPPATTPHLSKGWKEKTFRNRSIPGWISSLPRKWWGDHSSVIGQFDWRQVVLSRGKQSHKASFGLKRSSPALSSNSTRRKLAPPNTNNKFSPRFSNKRPISEDSSQQIGQRAGTELAWDTPTPTTTPSPS